MVLGFFFCADAEVDMESGTCSSVSLCLRTAAAQTARPATFIATLRWETVPEHVRHRLPDALRSIGLRARLPHFKGKDTVLKSKFF